MEGENPSGYIGTLATSQNEKQSLIIKYKLKATQNAVDGDHKIKVRYKSDSYESWIILDSFRIKVQSHDAILAVEKFLTVPAITPPGEKVRLKITLKNYATSILKDIKIVLDISKEEQTPFAPVGSSNEKVVPYIGPQSNLTIDFEVLVDSDAASKAYRIPLNIAYSDALNKNYSKSNIVTVVVGDRPYLAAALERTDIYRPYSSGSVVLRFVNKGNPDIKFLNVGILPNENINIMGADEVYIGKLDSDDFSTAEFRLYVKGKGNAKIPIEATYKDTNNKDYKENFDVNLKIYDSDEAKIFGVKRNNNILLAVAAIVIIMLGYYYRKRRNKR